MEIAGKFPLQLLGLSDPLLVHFSNYPLKSDLSLNLYGFTFALSPMLQYRICDINSILSHVRFRDCYLTFADPLFSDDYKYGAIDYLLKNCGVHGSVSQYPVLLVQDDPTGEVQLAFKLGAIYALNVFLLSTNDETLIHINHNGYLQILTKNKTQLGRILNTMLERRSALGQ